MLTIRKMEKLRDFINKNFKEIHKSPYSNSFYNKEVDWGYKPKGVLRISDHWNFGVKGALHCETTAPVKENAISIGKFNGEKFEILKSFEGTSYNKLDFSKPIYTLYVDYREGNSRGAYIIKIENGEIDKTYTDITSIYGFDLASCN